MKILFAGPDPDLVMTASGDDREPGLHVSDVTKRMAYEKDRKLNPTTFDLETVDQGFTWEGVVEHVLSRRHKRPGQRPKPFQAVGMWHSPDWITDDPKVQHEEWKATKKTMRRSFEDVGWHWLPNVKAYVLGLLELGLIRDAITRFRVWYINGDYTFDDKLNDQHMFRNKWRIDIQWTPRELDENRRSILTYAQHHGMLEGSCLATESPTTQALTASLTDRSRKGFPPPAPSSKPGRIVTFPRTKTSRTPRSGS